MYTQVLTDCIVWLEFRPFEHCTSNNTVNFNVVYDDRWRDHSSSNKKLSQMHCFQWGTRETKDMAKVNYFLKTVNTIKMFFIKMGNNICDAIYRIYGVDKTARRHKTALFCYSVYSEASRKRGRERQLWVKVHVN